MRGPTQLWITLVDKNSSNQTVESVTKEIYEILGESDGELEAGKLRVICERKHGRNHFPESINLKMTLEKLSVSGKFHIETRGSSLWITLPDKCSDSQIVQCNSEEICELLEEADGELNIAILKKRYEEKFGRAPFPDRVKMKKGLEELSVTGKFQLGMRGPSQFWIILPPPDQQK